MSDQSDIPILTDLIEKGIEITMSDLGLDDDTDIEIDDATIIDDNVIDVTRANLGLDDDTDIEVDDAIIDDNVVDVTRPDPGLDDDTDIDVDDTTSDDNVVDVTRPNLGAIDPFEANPALEYAIQSILDEHMELAWQKIKLLIQRDLNQPKS